MRKGTRGPEGSDTARSRRRFLAGLAGTAAASALFAPATLRAQQSAEAEATETPETSGGSSFSFEMLSAQMKAAAEGPHSTPETITGFLTGLDYDAYQRIRFAPDRVRWAGLPNFRLNAFHLGWLFNEPVHIHEVVDGVGRPMDFSTADFLYPEDSDIPRDSAMPGVAGFRLLNPLNSAKKWDELVAFLGASYFRALGEGNTYGLSARGLAVNTGLPGGEEFPRFSDFWLERPKPSDETVTLYAALRSASVTGAFRFIIRPGATTTMEVTARLYAREDIEQLGIAPLTSMYLYGGADPGAFDDFRPAVHDSEALVLDTEGGETFLRPLVNPPRLANSYLGAKNPRAFGLVQRSRDFDQYLDAEAHYERRPSLMVEPIGDWGHGTVRLMEIPSDLEVNDNIVAFWVPEAPLRAGDELEVSYRLRWGMHPRSGEASGRAHVLRTRVGKGGISGVDEKTDRRKFVIDFSGGPLAELPEGADVTPLVSVQGGELAETVLSRIEGTNDWRLVIEARNTPGRVAELRARIDGAEGPLSETWLYQWVSE